MNESRKKKKNFLKKNSQNCQSIKTMFRTKEWSVSCNNETVTSTFLVVLPSIEESELSDNDQPEVIKRQDQTNMPTSTQAQHEGVESTRIYEKGQHPVCIPVKNQPTNMSFPKRKFGKKTPLI